jgi:hypothetical protein
MIALISLDADILLAQSALEEANRNRMAKLARAIHARDMRAINYPV